MLSTGLDPPGALAKARPERLQGRRASVRAPGRLHLGFLDPAGSLGRRFGSIGLVIEDFETALELSLADEHADDNDEPVLPLFRDPTGFSALPPLAPSEADTRRAESLLELLYRLSGQPERLRLRLLRALPAHAGLGSGTQLALAVGHAFSAWHGLGLASATLARWLGRGLRSGIGIAGFDQGGLLVDGGPGADGQPAALLARLSFPPGWRVVVVLDPDHRGLSGQAERDAIAALAPLSRAASADICHQVLMRVLAGAAGAEFAPFAAGVTRIQQRLGEHFAPVQGGSAYASPAVGRLLGWVAAQVDHPVGIGQSSWGPTGFVFVESQAQAEALVEAVRSAAEVAAGLQLRIVRGRNQGGCVSNFPAPPDAC